MQSLQPQIKLTRIASRYPSPIRRYIDKRVNGRLFSIKIKSSAFAKRNLENLVGLVVWLERIFGSLLMISSCLTLLLSPPL